MLASLLRLFALRPLLSIAILGIPLLVLAAIGLFTVLIVKFLVFIVLPIALIVWLVRKFTRPSDDTSTTTKGTTI
jgi:type IV secretory pathway VirB3-like protein